MVYLGFGTFSRQVASELSNVFRQGLYEAASESGRIGNQERLRGDRLDDRVSIRSGV